MAWQTSKRVWDSVPQNVIGSERLMLLALAEKADEHGICWPAYATLAKMVGVNDRSAIRLIDNLEKDGLIFINKQQGKNGGRGYTNVYFITVGLSQRDIETTKAIHPMLKKGVTHNTLKRVTRITPKTQKGVTGDKKGVMGNTRTIMEPSESITTATISAADILTNIYLLTANGKPTQTGADIINSILVEYPADIIIYACQQAELNTTPSDDKRNLSYIEAVCKRKASGQPDKPYKNGASQNGHQKEGSQQNRQAPVGNSPTALEHSNQQSGSLGRVSKGLGDALKARSRTGGGST